MMTAALLLAMTPPPPPPTPERTTPLPTYSATCLLAGADARDYRLSVRIEGIGETRRVALNSASGPLKKLVMVDQSPSTISTGTPEQRWSTTDAARGTLDGKTVVLWFEVEPDVSRGAEVRIKDALGSGIPLYAGMCRANPLQMSSSR
jgi:hypothetical protein